MAATSYGVNNALAVKTWAKKLFVEALKATKASRFMGTTSSSLIQRRGEVSKGPGDRITIGLRMQLTGDGVAGDATLEGNEEALTTYSDTVYIDQLRHAVRSGGKMSEQRIPFEVREEAMSGLRDWWADRIDTAFFNQIAGASVSQTHGNTTTSTTTDSRYTGSQSCTAPDANHLFSSSATHDNTTEASLSATTTFALNLADIDRAVAKAKTLTPAIRPLKVNGEDKFVLFIHPYATYQLRTVTATGQYQDIQKAAITGGQITNNPLYTGSLGEYNGTILHEDARVPVVPSISANTSYRRAIFCGAQAASMAYGQNNTDGSMSWVEELFDYKNQLGVSAGMIWGLKKMVFNSADFGTIVIAGYAPSV
jgi:N4-gp56 family major capsid protein